jgi:hypothetical protein
MNRVGLCEIGPNSENTREYDGSLDRFDLDNNPIYPT